VGHARAAILLISTLASFVGPRSGAAEPEEYALERPPLDLLGAEVAPGERRELWLTIGESFAGVSVTTPVIVLHGSRPGPTLCLTGGVHGDEINGVEIVRRALTKTDPQTLSGTLIGVPIVNLQGFRRSSRYLPDRRDLNRHFPGRIRGSSASRLAHRIFDGIIRRCDALVDFHTGSFYRRNLPQVRADLSRPDVHDLALGFGAEIVVHTVGTEGTLRRSAVEAGVPAITYEAGEPMEFREQEVHRGVQGAQHLMAHLGMVESGPWMRSTPDIFYRSRWIRANDGGIFLTLVRLGDRVRAGKVLGRVTDPVTNERSEVRSPWRGRVIGMAVNQMVMPGFAAYHLGIDAAEPSEEASPPDADLEAGLDAPVEIDERPE
jgi:predicted deacylase